MIPANKSAFHPLPSQQWTSCAEFGIQLHVLVTGQFFSWIFYLILKFQFYRIFFFFSWFYFMGDIKSNPYSPFQIDYIHTQEPIGNFTPLDPEIIPCYKSINVSIKYILDLELRKNVSFNYLIS